MKLLPVEIQKILKPLYSQDNISDPTCNLKYFLDGWTWYIIEGEKQEDGDWLFFAKVISPMCPEYKGRSKTAAGLGAE